MVILLYRQQTLCITVGLLASISCGTFHQFIIRTKDLSNLFDLISNFSVFKFILNMSVITIYGWDRCPPPQRSKTIYDLDLMDEDEFVENSAYVWILILVFRVMAFIALIVSKNPKFSKILINYLMNKFKVKHQNNTTNEIPLQTICGSVSQIQVFENQIQLNSNEESEQMNTTFIENIEENQQKQRLSIAWIDMTLKVEKTLYSEQKLILRGIKGFIKFGTLTALMGPSGAGKTSLLKALNGMYRNLMTNESKIYLSKSVKIRTCFIAQDQREHIINGLTVNQCLIYSSKLKNCGQTVDHFSIVGQLMEELAINDIKNSNIEKCSSGQQKRIVMAMELTSKVKPNLICVDEPTSGVDSYSSLLVKNYLINTYFNSLSTDDSMLEKSGQRAQPFNHSIYTSAKSGNSNVI